MHYIENYDGPKYDVVIMDIVDSTESKEVAKLYTVEFYTKIKNIVMNENSVFITQSSALHLLNHNCSSRIRKTAEAVFGNAVLYGTFHISFREYWSFVIYVPNKNLKELKLGVGVDMEIKKREMEENL